MQAVRSQRSDRVDPLEAGEFQHPASGVAVGDFNGDNKPDLAVANETSNTVSVLLGNGNGTFAAKVDYATGGYPNAVAVGDFNGDNKPDLDVANYSSDTVSILSQCK